MTWRTKSLAEMTDEELLRYHDSVTTEPKAEIKIPTGV